MQVIASKTVYYPSFHIGCLPQSVECEIKIVKTWAHSNVDPVAKETFFLKTPFAMLDATETTSLDSPYAMRGYYATQEECDAYLAAQYPHAALAAPLMHALSNRMRSSHGTPMSGAERFADQVEVFRHEIFTLARGDKKHSEKEIKAVLKRIAK